MPFFIPDFSNDIHHEIEIVLKINKTGKHIQKEFAHTYYNEITIGIDFTARDIQKELKENGHPWEKAKAFDNSAAVGSFIDKHNFENVNNINHVAGKNAKTIEKSKNKLQHVKNVTSGTPEKSKHVENVNKKHAKC